MRLWRPLCIMLQATSKAYIKPQQAAEKSNAKAFLKPSLPSTIDAVEGWI